MLEGVLAKILVPDGTQDVAVNTPIAVIAGEGEEKQLAMAPSRLQEFIVALNQVFERQAMLGETPVLLTGPQIRPYVRSIIERVRPTTTVLSQNEIHPKARLRTLGQV